MWLLLDGVFFYFSRSTGQAEAPQKLCVLPSEVIRVFGHTVTGQSACGLECVLLGGVGRPNDGRRARSSEKQITVYTLMRLKMRLKVRTPAKTADKHKEQRSDSSEKICNPQLPPPPEQRGVLFPPTPRICHTSMTAGVHVHGVFPFFYIQAGAQARASTRWAAST